MRTRPTAWPSSSAPTPSAPTMPQTNAVGLLHAEMRLAGSLIMARGGRATRCRPAARSPSTATAFPTPSRQALEAHPLITIQREEVAGLPPADWDQAIIATGPLTAPALAAVDRRGDRRRRARLLRRHRADRPFRHDRHGHLLVPVALRQGRAGRHRQGLHQLPDGQGPISCLRAALLAGEKTEFKQWEGTPYFDGCLPIEVMAERGARRCATGR